MGWRDYDGDVPRFAGYMQDEAFNATRLDADDDGCCPSCAAPQGVECERGCPRGEGR